MPAGRVAASDAPDVGDGEEAQGFLAFLFGVDDAASVVGFVFLGKLTGYLGQRFGWCDAYGDGDARAALHGARYVFAVGLQLFVTAHAAKVEERFVDAVDVKARRELAQQHHHAVAHVAIERVVGTENGHAALFQLSAHLKEYVAALQP